MRASLRTILAIAGLCGLLCPAGRAQEPLGVRMHEEVSPGGEVLPEEIVPGEEPLLGEPVPAMRISMEFQDAGLKDILKAFSKQTGLNLVASPEVQDRPITLYLEDVEVMDALDQLLRVADLTSERPLGSEIYLVKPRPKEEIVLEPVGPPELAEPLTETRVYRLKYARVSTSRLARAAEALGSQTPFEAQQLTAATGAGGGTGGGGGGGSGGGFGGGGGGEKVGVDLVIQELLTPLGKVVVDPRTNSLIVTDVPENFARIEAVLNALDARTAQLLIEAEVLETTLGKVKDLGIEWAAASTEGDVASLTLGSRTTRFPFGSLDDGVAPTATPTGFGLSTLDFSTFKGVLQALEKDTDTKILASPKVLTLDNESAVIRLTSQQAVSIESLTVSESGNVIQTPERMTTGVILVVTPQVNEDGYVTMLVEPSVARVIASQVGKDIRDPRTRSARAMVRIRQGDTLVLGGLIDRSEEDIVQRVPILSGIPVLGELFKNTEKNDTATELIVFVTPRILDEPTGPQLATAAPGAQEPAAAPPLSEREQEGPRQEIIERTLNRLEESTL
jgi:type IV pilus secretin PilQ/predicted competence protein